MKKVKKVLFLIYLLLVGSSLGVLFSDTDVAVNEFIKNLVLPFLILIPITYFLVKWTREFLNDTDDD